ncbi:hypothetical protein [Nostoc sp.]|uniref:hypothetical protein n=1 Tax=Nostoc sp. TaxID=1180 RepID=UPI002FF247C3
MLENESGFCDRGVCGRGSESVACRQLFETLRVACFHEVVRHRLGGPWRPNNYEY